MSDPLGSPALRESNEPDAILVSFVRLMNAMKGAIDIGFTLTLGGSVISGQVVSGAAFFDELKTTVAAAAHGDATPIYKVLAEQFGNLAESFRSDAQAASSDDESTPDPRYIHLRTANLWAPGAQDPLHVGLWRGRLRDVSGWTFGTRSV